MRWMPALSVLFAILLPGCGTVAGGDTPGSAPETDVLTLLDISRVEASSPDFVGGVDISIAFTSLADSTIDYVRVRADAYNAVGDQVVDDLGRDIYLQYTGPILPSESRVGYWDVVIYNSSARCFELTQVEVELRDDTVVTYETPSEIGQIMSVPNDCSV